jgi:predicted GNAT family acetyltransferase
VAVVPDARRRGYGAALTLRATNVQPGQPASLVPSPMAARLYERLGYASIGYFSVWHRRSRP